jgi:tetratricopeptide (TPR) repeat protein
VPPIDRTATLRAAEKLLRQGKLQPAIEEYLRVVEDQPRDWNTANMLGDLYVRAGQVDKAVEQFTRIADSLSGEGFLPKAGALYKKILKLKPDHEHALVQGGEIAASQGLLADARALFNTVAERRRSRGDARGAAQIRIRLGSVDPADFDGRMAAASARVELGDIAGAVRDLKEIAADLAGEGRQADAVEALREAAQLDPLDEEIRARLLDVYVAAEDFARAGECATTVAQFKMLSAALEQRGRSAEALDMLRDAARLDPHDDDLKAHLARAFVARGDMVAAAEYLTVETAGNDPALLMTVAEIRLRSGSVTDGLAIARRLLEGDPSRRDQVALIGWNIAEQAPEAGFAAVELASEVSIAQGDWASAAAALQEFVTRVSTHVPALMRLVEICVDGGLEATMYSAQAQLADAYIAVGSAAEARVIAEDLVAREPWERANIERFRRTLVLMNEPDPDALIAERLSGESPFMSTDVSLNADELPPFVPTTAARDAVPDAPPPPIRPDPAPSSAPAPDVPRAKAPRAKASVPRSKKDASQFALSANAIDIGNMLLGSEATPPTAHSGNQSVEVDLSIVLDDINRPSAPPISGAPASPGAASDLDGVFTKLRDGTGRRSAADVAEGDYRRASVLREAGDIDGCMVALEAASRAPRLRFAAASGLARLHVERGQTAQAIEWFERAAQAPAPTSDESHQLLYELAVALESVGEVERSLAVSLELQADAGAYRDVAARIDRLAKA